jgi:hypothetical protein
LYIVYCLRRHMFQIAKIIYQCPDRQHKIYKWYASCLVSWLYETHESSVQWRYFKMIFSKGQIIMTSIKQALLRQTEHIPGYLSHRYVKINQAMKAA